MYRRFAPTRPRVAGVLSFALAFLLLLSVALPAAAASGDRWFHVRVDEEDGAQVSVNLPLSLIEMAFEMIPEEISNEVEVELNEEGFSVDQLRQLWEELRGTGDATFLTVREDDTNIEVRREGAFFVAQTVGDSDTHIDVRFPVEVIDALFSSGPNTLNFGAAVRALADYGDGDMVTVRDGESTVRVWVDDVNEGR